METITRRVAFASIGAVASLVALTVPAVAAVHAERKPNDAHPDMELLDLVGEWERVNEACNDDPTDYPMGEDPHIHRLDEIEAKLVSITPQTAAGFGAKVLALTSFGGFTFAECGGTILADALASVPPPIRQGENGERLRQWLLDGEV